MSKPNNNNNSNNNNSLKKEGTLVMDFINILPTAFMRADPKSTKR